MNISAQVVLKPTFVAPAEEITSEFKLAGFQVGALFANSFSIAGPQELFERHFGVRLEVTPEGEVHVAGQSGEARFELPVEKLSRRARENIQTVVFTPLPDFGP